MRLKGREMIRMNFESIRKKNVPIILFGAGFIGRALLTACRAAKIDVACFSDNNSRKIGPRIMDCKVVNPCELKDMYDKAYFIVATSDIADVVGQLKELGYTDWCPGGYLLKDFDVSTVSFDAPVDYVEYIVSSCILCHERYMSHDGVFLRSVDLVITERCSLKCRDCSNLMQYYKRPQNCETQNVLESINGLFAVVDNVHELRVIGGEPFMNNDLHLIVKRLNAEQKVDQIVVYTNSTIIPKGKNLNALKKAKILLFMTDYGSLSPKIEPLKEVLNENGIRYYVSKAQSWTDCSKIERNNRTVAENMEIYLRCCAKNYFTLMDGKFYRCPFSAHVDRLKAVPNYHGDHVDIPPMPAMPNDLLQLKEKIKGFIYSKDYLDSCDYCKGRFFGDIEIVPAIQVDAPMVYKRLR